MSQMFLVCMVKCVTICLTQFQKHSTDISALFYGKLLIEDKSSQMFYHGNITNNFNKTNKLPISSK